MSTSDSLFDNSITSNPVPSQSAQEPSVDTQVDMQGQEPYDSAPIYHSDGEYDSELEKSLVTFRILVSRREAGAIIGKEGSNISQIREKYDIKAGVSKVIDGCIDRILSVTGTVDNIPNALVEIAQSVTDANVQTIEEAEQAGTNPLRLISYEFPPLRPLIQRPNYKSEEYKNNYFLRMLIPNSQIGTLIGKGGIRIKSIQETNNIKMVASKDFLEHSNERLVEIQGDDKENLKNAIKSIAKYLIRDYQGNSSVTFYVPCSPIDTRGYNGGRRFNGNGNNVNNGPGGYNGPAPMGGNPHIGGPDYSHPVAPNNFISLPPADPRLGKEIIKKIAFPNEYIGALIGKRGSRIQEIRIVSQCAVAIENENTEDDEREITLVGTKASVDKAIDLLNMYYEREQKRRMMD
jgi:heterogeneous nuclear rnp K-like protein 2